MSQSDSTCATRQEFQVTLPRDKAQMLADRIGAPETEVRGDFFQCRGRTSLFHTCPNKIKHLTLSRREFVEVLHSRFKILHICAVCKRGRTRRRCPRWRGVTQDQPGLCRGLARAWQRSGGPRATAVSPWETDRLRSERSAVESACVGGAEVDRACPAVLGRCADAQGKSAEHGRWRRVGIFPRPAHVSDDIHGAAAWPTGDLSSGWRVAAGRINSGCLTETPSPRRGAGLSFG